MDIPQIEQVRILIFRAKDINNYRHVTVNYEAN